MSVLVRQGHQFCSADGKSHGLCSWVLSDTGSRAIGAATQCALVRLLDQEAWRSYECNYEFISLPQCSGRSNSKTTISLFVCGGDWSQSMPQVPWPKRATCFALEVSSACLPLNLRITGLCSSFQVFCQPFLSDGVGTHNPQRVRLWLSSLAWVWADQAPGPEKLIWALESGRPALL